MKFAALALIFAVVLAAPVRLHAQAANIPSAAPPTPAGTSEQRGRALLDQMVVALGGDVWLNRTNMQSDGRGSQFFHGQPNPYLVEYHEIYRYAASGKPEADRIGFLTPRGMLLPGKKVDVVQIMTEGHGYEITYKGKSDLPKEQVDDYFRRHRHSVDEVVHTWIHAPGVMILSEGTEMVERHIADKVTVLSADNDAVTLDIDAATHLPIQRSYQWRNPQFHDYDHEVETYDDYHSFQGIETPMTITRYHNGDMTSQRYLTKVAYNVQADPKTFDPNAVTVKLKK